MNKFLKFESKEQADAVLFTEQTIEEGVTQLVPIFRNTDVIGVIYRPTGKTLTSEEGFEYPEMSPLVGWHVNVFVEDSEDGSVLEQYEVVPANPVRVWAA